MYPTICNLLDADQGGGRKNTKFEFLLACKHIPFFWFSHFQKHKAHLQFPAGSASSGCHFSRNIYKGNSEKIRKQDISVVGPKKYFASFDTHIEIYVHVKCQMSYMCTSSQPQHDSAAEHIFQGFGSFHLTTYWLIDILYKIKYI